MQSTRSNKVEWMCLVSGIIGVEWRGKSREYTTVERYMMSEDVLVIGPQVNICDLGEDHMFMIDGSIYRYERTGNGRSYGERVMCWSFVEERYVWLMDNWSDLYHWPSSTVVKEAFVQ